MDLADVSMQDLGVNQLRARLGVWELYLAILPRLKMAFQPLRIWPDVGVTPVREETLELHMKSCHMIPSILR